MPDVALAKPEVCRTVSAKIDAVASAIPDARLLIPLAPHLSELGVGPLLARAKTATTTNDAMFTYLALGLSRHATALSRLMTEPRSADSRQRLGQSIARLALGDGSRSATITTALYEGTLDERRATATALSMMEQKRPQIMLFDAMNDEDEAVQLAAGRVHYPRYSRRARRVLLHLLQAGAPETREAVAEFLVDRHHRFNTSALGPFPDHLRGRALVDAAVRSPRAVRLLRQQIASRRDVDRRAAYAALAASGSLSSATLARLGKRVARASATAPAELQMALALLGEATSIQTLATYDGANAAAAADVFYYFSGASAPYSQLDVEHARGLARAFEAWVVRSLVDDAVQRRIFEALYQAEASAAVQLARARLGGPVGAGLEAAIAVLEKEGSLSDIEQLLSIADRASPAIRVEAYDAAASLCAAAR